MREIFLARVRRLRAFTTLELLVALVVVGILTTLAILKYQEVQERVYVAQMLNDLRNYATFQESHLGDLGLERYALPNELEEVGYGYSEGVYPDSSDAGGDRYYLRVRHRKTKTACNLDYSRQDPRTHNAPVCEEMPYGNQPPTADFEVYAVPEGGAGTLAASESASAETLASIFNPVLTLGMVGPTISFSGSYSSWREQLPQGAEGPALHFPVGRLLNFVPESSDPDGDEVTYHWRFGEMGTAGEPLSKWRFHEPGEVPVTLTVTDSRGATTRVTKRVKLGLDGNAALVAQWDPCASFGTGVLQELVQSNDAALLWEGRPASGAEWAWQQGPPAFLDLSGSFQAYGEAGTTEAAGDFALLSTVLPTGTGEQTVLSLGGAGGFRVGFTPGTGLTVGGLSFPGAPALWRWSTLVVQVNADAGGGSRVEPFLDGVSLGAKVSGERLAMGGAVRLFCDASGTRCLRGRAGPVLFYKGTLGENERKARVQQLGERLSFCSGGNRGPQAAFVWSPKPPQRGGTVLLDASDSYDPDGDAIGYSWSIVSEEGERLVLSGGPEKNWVIPSGSTSAFYDVTLEVRDAEGAGNAFTQRIAVNNPPAVAIEGPDTISAGISTLFLSRSTDPDGDALTQSWSLDEVAVGVDSIVNVQVDTMGVYTLRLRVKDARGAVAEVSKVLVAQKSVAISSIPAVEWLSGDRNVDPSVIDTVRAQISNNDTIAHNICWVAGVVNYTPTGSSNFYQTAVEGAGLSPATQSCQTLAARSQIVREFTYQTKRTAPDSFQVRHTLRANRSDSTALAAADTFMMTINPSGAKPTVEWLTGDRGVDPVTSDTVQAKITNHSRRERYICWNAGVVHYTDSKFFTYSLETTIGSGESCLWIDSGKSVTIPRTYLTKRTAPDNWPARQFLRAYDSYDGVVGTPLEHADTFRTTINPSGTKPTVDWTTGDRNLDPLTSDSVRALVTNNSRRERYLCWSTNVVGYTDSKFYTYMLDKTVAASQECAWIAAGQSRAVPRSYSTKREAPDNWPARQYVDAYDYYERHQNKDTLYVHADTFRATINPSGAKPTVDWTTGDRNLDPLSTDSVRALVTNNSRRERYLCWSTNVVLYTDSKIYTHSLDKTVAASQECAWIPAGQSHAVPRSYSTKREAPDNWPARQHLDAFDYYEKWLNKDVLYVHADTFRTTINPSGAKPTVDWTTGDRNLDPLSTDSVRALVTNNSRRERYLCWDSGMVLYTDSKYFHHSLDKTISTSRECAWIAAGQSHAVPRSYSTQRGAPDNWPASQYLNSYDYYEKWLNKDTLYVHADTFRATINPSASVPQVEWITGDRYLEQGQPDSVRVALTNTSRRERFLCWYPDVESYTDGVHFTWVLDPNISAANTCAWLASGERRVMSYGYKARANAPKSSAARQKLRTYDYYENWLNKTPYEGTSLFRTTIVSPLYVSLSCPGRVEEYQSFTCSIGASGGVAPYTYDWGATSRTFTAGAAGESVQICGTATDIRPVSRTQCVTVQFYAPEPPVAFVECTVTEIHAGETFSCTLWGEGGKAPYTYSWGTQVGYFSSETPGVMEICGTVTDANGITSAPACDQVTNTNQPPVASIACDRYMLKPGEAASCQLYGADPNPHDWNQYTFSWSPNPRDFSWDAEGTYEIQGTVTDRHGASHTAVDTIRVSASVTCSDPKAANYGANAACEYAPEAAFVYAPKPVYTRTRITFDGSSSADPAGGGLSYRWEWGDGRVTSGETKPQISWVANASYNVCLTVTDVKGRTGRKCETVNVLRETRARFNYSYWGWWHDNGDFFGDLGANHNDHAAGQWTLDATASLGDVPIRRYWAEGTLRLNREAWQMNDCVNYQNSPSDVWTVKGTRGTFINDHATWDANYTPSNKHEHYYSCELASLGHHWIDLAHSGWPTSGKPAYLGVGINFYRDGWFGETPAFMVKSATYTLYVEDINGRVTSYTRTMYHSDWRSAISGTYQKSYPIYISDTQVASNPNVFDVSIELGTPDEGYYTGMSWEVFAQDGSLVGSGTSSTLRVTVPSCETYEVRVTATDDAGGKHTMSSWLMGHSENADGTFCSA